MQAASFRFYQLHQQAKRLETCVIESLSSGSYNELAIKKRDS